MSRALAFLLVRSLRGRLVRMARRLREPRYLAGFLVGGGWMLFWMSRFAFSNDGDVSLRLGIPGEAWESMALPLERALRLAIGLVLTLGVTLWWAVPLGGTGLELSEAELHLLLPAPVARRRLIQYGLLRSQPGVLVGATIMTVFSLSPSVAAMLARFLGLWLFFTIWDLHGKGRGLWLARLRELSPAAAWRRRTALYGGLAALWIIIGAALGGLATRVLSSLPANLDDIQVVVRTLADTHLDGAWNGVLGWCLAPMIWLTAPYFAVAGTAGTWTVAGAFALPLLLLALHHEWVVRSQVRFEEAELARARRRSRKADPAARFWRLSERRRRRQPFRLRPHGAPETALLWKNLMLVHRLPLRALALSVTGSLGVVLAAVALAAPPDWIVRILQVGGALLIAVPPLLTGRGLRNDLRNDLLYLESLRAWPVRGSQAFLAEVAAPALLTLTQVLAGAALLVGIDLITRPRVEVSGLARALGVPGGAVVPLLVAAALPLAAAVTGLSICLENLAALAFPSWVHLGLGKQQAAAKFGQNLLVFLVLSLALLAGIAPGAIAVAVILAAQVLVWGVAVSGWQLPVLGLVAALPTAVVVAALVRAGGALWSRFDPSQELIEGRV